jgi:small subunit ribosomal protein S17
MENKKLIRKLKGIVTSDKMDKTVAVEVTRLKKDPRYKKFYKVSTKYKAHDQENQYKVGDEVIIELTRPMSKDKRWIVVEKVK